MDVCGYRNGSYACNYGFVCTARPWAVMQHQAPLQTPETGASAPSVPRQVAVSAGSNSTANIHEPVLSPETEERSMGEGTRHRIVNTFDC